MSIPVHELLNWWAKGYNSKNLHACLRLDLLEIINTDCFEGKMTEIFDLGDTNTREDSIPTR